MAMGKVNTEDTFGALSERGLSTLRHPSFFELCILILALLPRFE